MSGNAESGGFEFDLIEFWRCPQLGGPVTFGYCRVMNEGLPCARIIACWGGSVDVAAYLTAAFPERGLEDILAGGSKDRLTRIMEALDRAAKRREGE